MQVDYQRIVKCYACDAPVLMSDARYRTLVETRASFWCPAGHEQHFAGKTDDRKRIEQLERQLDDARRRILELCEEAAHFRCVHPRCRFRHKNRRIVLGHMRECERAEKPKQLPANAGPNAQNTRVH